MCRLLRRMRVRLRACVRARGRARGAGADGLAGVVCVHVKVLRCGGLKVSLLRGWGICVLSPASAAGSHPPHRMNEQGRARPVDEIMSVRACFSMVGTRAYLSIGG